jgi:hypothetical protein
MRLTVVRVNPPTKPQDGEQVTPCRASIARMVGQVVPSALAVIRRVIRGLAQSRCRATQGTPISRASSRLSLARPNICRFTSFRWVICPSVWPFDQGSVSAAATAALSFKRPPAKDARRLRAAASIQTSRSGRLHSRITAWKRDSRTRASSSIRTCASIVATSMASAFVRLSPRSSSAGRQCALTAPSPAIHPAHARCVGGVLPILQPPARCRRTRSLEAAARARPRCGSRLPTRHRARADGRQGCSAAR